MHLYIYFYQVVTKRQLLNEDEIHESAEQFVAEVKALLSHYDEDSILNTDQLGLELQAPSTVTLSFQDEKTILTAVRLITNTTHNYAVQPIIVIRGKIACPVYVCLKEVNGRMIEKARANLQRMKSIVVTFQYIRQADYDIS